MKKYEKRSKSDDVSPKKKGETQKEEYNLKYKNKEGY
jgi:hypothetical protein